MCAPLSSFCVLTMSFSLSLSLSLMSHLAPFFPRPPTRPFISSLSFSHVLQHPGFPATWLCGEPDWGSLKQRGALGLRQRLQADWERHSGVQEDHPQLLHLGRPGACLPGWGRLLLFHSVKSPAVAASSSLALFLLPHIWPQGSTHSAPVMLASHLNQSDWEPVPSQLERKQKSIPSPLPPSVNSYFVKLLLANLELVCAVCLLQSGLSQLIKFGVFLVLFSFFWCAQTTCGYLRLCMIACTKLHSGRKATDGELIRIFHNTPESKYVMCLKITQRPSHPHSWFFFSLF